MAIRAPSEALQTAASSPVPLNGARGFWERAFGWLPSWKPTSEAKLEAAEKELLKDVKSSYSDSYVPVGRSAVVRTVTMEPDDPTEEERTPIVMVHGFGAGFLQFYKNLDHLHSQRRLLAIDLPGFARSTRVSFSPDALEAEEEMVECIESWRKAVGVERFILLGHSFGGFLATSYTMRYPSHVRHLILADPWGLADGLTDEEFRDMTDKMPRRVRVLRPMFGSFMPFTPIRAAGPWGPNLLSGMRRDLGNTFGEGFLDYVYHCNAQKPTGEAAFFSMQKHMAWARFPLATRIPSQLDPGVPMTLIYGERSWIKHAEGVGGRHEKTIQDLIDCRRDAYISVHTVEGAGHHVHANQPEKFNTIVNHVCSLVDEDRDTKSEQYSSSQCN